MINVYALVVTHNRRNLLERCIEALHQQSRPANQILIVDNASSDGTQEWASGIKSKGGSHISYLRLNENLGGAGGFSEGARIARDMGADLIWMMDDDAEPLPTALEALLDRPESELHQFIHGSIAITGAGKLCWPLSSIDGSFFELAACVPERQEVTALPFLGILVPSRVFATSGYPDPGYFIAGDDIEFCFRAREQGYAIFAISSSRIYHPPSDFYRFGIGRWSPVCFRIAPWKRYYDVRNRILTSYKLGTLHVFTKTLPATMLRMTATLINEPKRVQQLHAYLAGTIDGVRKKKGRRHQLWRISQN
jgi:rhamnopyranosyl-N-acetylglucosaminyl-diphospho-decaprenol beta-1,3/1,4-galactofuranosyltransferase